MNTRRLKHGRFIHLPCSQVMEPASWLFYLLLDKCSKNWRKYMKVWTLVARRRFELLSAGFFSTWDPEPAMRSRIYFIPLATTLPGSVI